MIDFRVLASSSHGNCYVVDDGRTKLLLECGIKFRDIEIGTGFDLQGFAGCLVTHDHDDHIASAAKLMEVGVDLYMSRGTADAKKLTGHRLHVVKSMVRFEVGSWTVLPFDAVHDVAEPLGHVLMSDAGNVFFLTDSACCKYVFTGIQFSIVAIACNYSSDQLRDSTVHGARKHRTRGNHMSLERVIEMLLANDLSECREIHLLHLSDTHGDEARFKREVAAATGKPVYIAPKVAEVLQPKRAAAGGR